nr:MAG TPA: hypothetical protein [Caudoviricetes sp.]
MLKITHGSRNKQKREKFSSVILSMRSWISASNYQWRGGKNFSLFFS